MSSVETSVIALATVFLVHLALCCGAGVRLGYKAGLERNFESERVKVSLTCRSQDILVNLNFSEPFRGIVHAGKKDGVCSFRGDGSKVYSLSVRFGSCGTVHVLPQDSFANTLTIRYHPALELEGDVIQTIMCKYGIGSVQVG